MGYSVGGTDLSLQWEGLVRVNDENRDSVNDKGWICGNIGVDTTVFYLQMYGKVG